MVVVAEVMGRICHRITLASVELDAQKTYMARSNRLVQMFRLDEEEEKRKGDGEGSDVDDDDSDMGTEVVVAETTTDVPTSHVVISGSSSASGSHY